MNYCRCECAYLSVIAGILAGVVIGVLSALGFVATGIIFWAYLAIGVAAVFLAPIYGANVTCPGSERCFCRYRRVLLAAAVGTILTAAAGLIVAAFASTTVIAIVLGLTTFFVVWLVGLVICLARCLCND